MRFPTMTRALFAAVVAAVSQLPVTANAVPSCTGNDLMAQLRADQPLLHAAVVAESARVPNGEAVLWKIEGSGAPSWLLGTIHMSDERVAKIDGAKKQALDLVRTVAVEVAGMTDRGQLQKEIAGNPGLIVMPDGKSMWDLVDDEQEDAVMKGLSKLGLKRGQVAKLQPWLPATMLAKSSCQTARETAGVPVLDQAVENYAQQRGLEVVGLETASEQLAAMSSMPLESQAAFLVDSARMSGLVDDYNETMIRLYLSRQVSAILPLQAALLGDKAESTRSDAMQHFVQALIVRRNHTMAERAEPLLRKGQVLIAVGALHLPGKEGLVALLRKQGFRLTAVE